MKLANTGRDQDPEPRTTSICEALPKLPQARPTSRCFAGEWLERVGHLRSKLRPLTACVTPGSEAEIAAERRRLSDPGRWARAVPQ
jgi:hypothetical protein